MDRICVMDQCIGFWGFEETVDEICVKCIGSKECLCVTVNGII